MEDISRIKYLELVDQMILKYEDRIERGYFVGIRQPSFCPICTFMVHINSNDFTLKCTRCPNSIGGDTFNGCIFWSSWITKDGERFCEHRLEVFKELKVLLENAPDTLSVEGMRGLQAKAHFNLGYK